MTTYVSGYQDLILRPATTVGEDFPPARPRQVREANMVIDYDVAVDVRTGGHIDIDIYRPDVAPTAVDLPTIVAWGAFGKHDRGLEALFADNHGVDPAWISKYTPFEAPDPAYWTSVGYAVAFANPRGTWNSPGTYTHGDDSEAEDYYDLVEWLGTQPWSNGKVGITGVSYLARSAYAVAALQPPHLAAIAPFESFVDMYREYAYHGGIPETRFTSMVGIRCGRGRGLVEDMSANFSAHPLFGDDEFWRSKRVDAASVTVPAFVVASWGDQGLHLRGTLDFFAAISSSQKWLEVHGRKKWQYFYRPTTVERITSFFDRYLKGVGDGLDSRPPVSIEVRDTVDVGTVRAENEWPPARTVPTPLHLDAKEHALRTEEVRTADTVGYDGATGRTTFEHTFSEDTELTGYMSLRLWISIESGDDADVFVAVEKIDGAGKRVQQIFYATFDDGPIAQGWLRASHRGLDENRSTALRPIHRHDGEERLEPGVPTPIDVEIWPSSTSFRAGEGVRLVVAGTDIYDEVDPGLPDTAPWPRHSTRNVGRHTLHTGGEFDSHLLIPRIS